ncbi:hypothetical protein AAF712_014743 [Marasmius tenuissimus]|uniref:CCHC-type domain-containing protein n=1 Tax=Marasmius tenuissimus TaxID=585030 RepID=A0ABR2ZB35_9AGAR
MTTTITNTRVSVKEEKKPAGVPPHDDKPPRPGSPSSSEPGTNISVPNDPDDNAIRDSFWSSMTNAFSELKERGIKPERFKGNCNKTDCFCYDFGRYLQFNIAFYPKQSEQVDLILSSIDHPWADARSLELENDHWDNSIPQDKKRWTNLADIRHRFQQDFGLAAPFTGYNNEALLWFFQAGMSPGLRQAVRGMEPEPEGLQKFIRAAIHKQNRYKQQQAESKLWRKPAATPVVNVRAASLAPAPQQMTPSQNPFNGTPVRKLTPEEREQCIREGHCFRCQQQDHNTPQCPSNTVPTAQPQVATNNPFHRNQAPAVQATTAPTPTPTPSTFTNPSPPAPADDPVASVIHMISQLSPEQSTAFFSKFSKTDF